MCVVWALITIFVTSINEHKSNIDNYNLFVRLKLYAWFSILCFCIALYWSYGVCIQKTAKQNNNHMLIRCKFKTNEEKNMYVQKKRRNKNRHRIKCWAQSILHGIEYRETRADLYPVKIIESYRWGGEWSAKCQGDTLNSRTKIALKCDLQRQLSVVFCLI